MLLLLLCTPLLFHLQFPIPPSLFLFLFLLLFLFLFLFFCFFLSFLFPLLVPFHLILTLQLNHSSEQPTLVAYIFQPLRICRFPLPLPPIAYPFRPPHPSLQPLKPETETLPRDSLGNTSDIRSIVPLHNVESSPRRIRRLVQQPE